MLKLSQTDFGKKIGKNYHSVMRWELGKVLPPVNVARHICETFGIRYEWLMNGTGDIFISEPVNEATEPAGPEYDAGERAIPYYTKLNNAPSDIIKMPGCTECSFAISVPPYSTPPSAEGDIAFIKTCDAPTSKGLYLITDKYGDTFIRFYDAENKIWISKLSEYPDINDGSVLIHGSVQKIIRQICF